MRHASWVQIPPLALSPLAQLVERVSFNNVVVSSILTGSTARLAQLVERQTFNLVVVGSSPTVSKE